jgi:ABC-type transport system involved in multi-copper enzyme maturation permease subunit
MITAIQGEMLKLRTIRLSFVLLATAAGLTALVAILGATQAGNSPHAPPPLNTAAGLTDVLSGTGLGMLMAAVLGITISTGEFRHATATATYLATPDRTTVLIAKAVTATLAGLLFGLVTSGVAIGTGLAFVAAKGYPVALGGATIARFAAGAVLGAGLLAAVGVGIGSLIRSQLAAIMTVLAWGIVVEQLIGGLFSSITRYLPFRAATSLTGAELGGGAHPLPFAAAAALVAGVAVLLSAVASRATIRQDIL